MSTKVQCVVCEGDVMLPAEVMEGELRHAQLRHEHEVVS
jgi:hypothetical protein